MPGEFQFIWTDASGDGIVQVEECRFAPLEIGSLTDFDRGLNINAGPTAFEVVRLLPNGAFECAKKQYPLPVDRRMDPVYRLIKLDWGVLETDDEGVAVLARSFWSNTSTLADAPTEARLEPHLWGHAIFPGQDSLGPRPPDAAKLLDSNAGAADDFELEEE